MKTMRRLSALVVVLALVLGLVAPFASFADEGGIIKISGAGGVSLIGKTFEVYKLLDAQVGEAANGEEPPVSYSVPEALRAIYNTKLGLNVDLSAGDFDENKFNQAVVAKIQAMSSTEVNDLANAIIAEDGVNPVKTIQATVEPVVIQVPSFGYYAVKDTSTSGPLSAVMVGTTAKTVDVTLKTEAISFSKKIMDVNDTERTALTKQETLNPADPKWQDSADYDIGDIIPFKLSATVASNASQFKGDYRLEFVDQLSQELTPVLDEQGNLKVVVKVGTDENAVVIDPSEYTVMETTFEGSKAFKVIFENIKEIDAIGDGSTVHVFLSAVLNDRAYVGYNGYTENMNDAKLLYSNDPDSEKTGDDTVMTETVWDTVKVFTYAYHVYKVDENDNELKGAGFTLYKKDKNLTPDNAKEGDLPSEGLKLVKAYPAGEDTTFDFVGIDDGEYVIKETTTPAGYNAIEDIEFKIEAEHQELAEDPKLIMVRFSKKDEKGDYKVADQQDLPPSYYRIAVLVEGRYYDKVVNKKGTVLPETGGMGTTVLYLVGSLLVIASGAVLVTRRVMTAKK